MTVILFTKVNSATRVPKGNRGFKWNANRCDSGTVPPTVIVRTPALLKYLPPRSKGVGFHVY